MKAHQTRVARQTEETLTDHAYFHGSGAANLTISVLILTTVAGLGVGPGSTKLEI